MPDPLTPIAPKLAKSRGFNPLTYPMNPESEGWIIDNVVEGLAKGKIPYTLVLTEAGIEVWRKPRCIK
jgi:hypothetical protein